MTIPSGTVEPPKDEWLDDDFDFPDDEAIRASDAEDGTEDEDWDVEMDLGKTGGAKACFTTQGDTAPEAQPASEPPCVFTIRPPIATPGDDDEEEDEGVSTIKAAALPKVFSKHSPPVDEDFEDAFSLPSDLVQLSLRPISHRSSKASIEWGDKDQTVSSQSSDTFSSLGFAENGSSNCTSAPDTDTDEDEKVAEDELDGLVVPTGLFESESGGKELAKLLESKKRITFSDEDIKIASLDPEDDFEAGLIIDHDVELSSSRLLLTTENVKRLGQANTRCKSAPPVPPPSFHAFSRVRDDRSRFARTPPVASVQQLRKLTDSPAFSRPSPFIRSQTSVPSTPLMSGGPFAPPRPLILRSQISHTNLKASSPTSSRQLGRKASLPSLSEASNHAQPSGSGFSSTVASQTGYNAPTASSRAKMQPSSSAGRTRSSEFLAPQPVKLTTLSSAPSALRLIMPTASSRLKSRSSVSSVLNTPTSAVLPSATSRPSSRPPLGSSTRSHQAPAQVQGPSLSAPKMLKRPKRAQTFGDGTELDAFEDLPLDREREGHYSVQPKRYGNCVPGISYAKVVSSGGSDNGPTRRVVKRQLESTAEGPKCSTSTTKTLKRTGRLEIPRKLESEQPAIHSKQTDSPSGVRKRRVMTPPSQTRKKPTLIRNLGGVGLPKVIGDMKWNPSTMRWEGNDQALRDFDNASSIRPALITHLTGSSRGSPNRPSAAGARVVGNMVFDPARMCWISTLPADEDEPDVFADLADDEDDDWDAKCATIRPSQGVSGGALFSSPNTDPPSPSRRFSLSGSESDRCSRASMVCDVDEAFIESCRRAEERHRTEMKSWLSSSRPEFDRSYLYEIRALATRQH
ncbi:uncharacterized protein LAESUDRAFT_714593 [Laetiporus sulphureus 93-53]|uniref:Uncharacterized protein n=1 Tax=Laetiporus sulphureus 93-53 TaxID=1314785 RepID=A0A165DYM5_9APHY|nr:uncharacterized protein LAESUDRAFT_714593 [Laetiporus sulphureus 93-53]KZT05895.1 hypothetical protein LAESUDRAFT_714593 [Laetiporus sulphureus 93-53]